MGCASLPRNFARASCYFEPSPRPPPAHPRWPACPSIPRVLRCPHPRRPYGAPVHPADRLSSALAGGDRNCHARRCHGLGGSETVSPGSGPAGALVLVFIDPGRDRAASRQGDELVPALSRSLGAPQPSSARGRPTACARALTRSRTVPSPFSRLRRLSASRHFRDRYQCRPVSRSPQIGQKAKGSSGPGEGVLAGCAGRRGRAAGCRMARTPRGDSHWVRDRSRRGPEFGRYRLWVAL